MSFMDSGCKSDRITNTILYMLAVDKMPLSAVENKGFKKLMKTIVPLYKVPSRRTVTRLLEDRYKTLKNNFIAKIDGAICYSLTCDNWTDITNQSYLGVTIHYLTDELKMKSGCIGVFPLYKNHTAEYLAKSLNTIIKEFKLNCSKITAIITDSAANIKLAIEKTVGKYKHLACFAHILSHLVPDALTSMSDAQEIIHKVKKIVTTVRKSIVASDELKNLQLRDGKTEGTVLRFIRDVPTRWNSTLYMLDRFLELEKYVYPVILKCEKPLDMLRHDEIKTLKEMISIMRPIERAITEISGEAYPTCSIIIPLVRCMNVTIYFNKPDTQIGITFKEKLQSAINNRCKNFENNKIMSIATILDPRFKKLHFEKSLAAATAVQHIESDLKKYRTLKDPQIDRELNTEMTVRQYSNLWDFHDNLVAKNNNCTEELNEVKQYLKQPIIDRKEDPFEYWKSMNHIFPSLYHEAVRYISTLGTSVPSERIFSQAGDIKNDDRSRLTGEHLNMLLFLSSLTDEDWALE
ncbi:zinc finger BED domain-containing protein 4-like [Monomorium pharaonis]|uniref:zinc finger BED domain-containing protein 4-like n=1 Tax=Monomorium pharaonis TaxID=307658 RepID=UPI00174768A2|nr:zinc finger BED domain-containing protein 4-like [Monomorium pharaonis]XP_036148065.1 zinc finger BED domain-containing protein 4-like [Monomorium pharaonis]XP_036148090.1 zinc finger BED domain-containing protein 4-like [Monomorium pharaonis]